MSFLIMLITAGYWAWRCAGHAGARANDPVRRGQWSPWQRPLPLLPQAPGFPMYNPDQVHEFWIQNMKTTLWQQAVMKAEMKNDPGFLEEPLLFL